MAEADTALEIADDDECGEAEATTTLHHLGDAVDVNQLVYETVITLFAIVPFITRRHILFLIFFRRRPTMEPPLKRGSGETGDIVRNAICVAMGAQADTRQAAAG